MALALVPGRLQAAGRQLLIPEPEAASKRIGIGAHADTLGEFL